MLPAFVGIAVAIALYAIGGGRYPLPVDLSVVGSVGLMAYTVTLQLTQRATSRPCTNQLKGS
ncbi:hypothetical protein [Streptomyces kronopolitis]|uniref:hypothetical protein n=1 Tax=Streptomyces kronopolitis TaxID=1612435 RepID=UPI003D96ECDB